MEGTGSPISFSSLACRVCQADGRAPLCASCVTSTGLQGSGPTPTFQEGKSVTFFVPSSVPSEPLVATCGLRHPWGSCVIVGTHGASDDDLSARRAGTGWADVPIDRERSVVGNPFSMDSCELPCRAFDELLGHVLLNDLNFDRVLPQYHRLFDDHQSGAACSEPVTRRLLLEISRKHGVWIREDCARLFSVEALRSWVAHHAAMMLSGQRLRLLSFCAEETCPCWPCHGQSLAGALLWACQRQLAVRRPRHHLTILVCVYTLCVHLLCIQLASLLLEPSPLLGPTPLCDPNAPASFLPRTRVSPRGALCS